MILRGAALERSFLQAGLRQDSSPSRLGAVALRLGPTMTFAQPAKCHALARQRCQRQSRQWTATRSSLLVATFLSSTTRSCRRPEQAISAAAPRPPLTRASLARPASWLRVQRARQPHQLPRRASPPTLRRCSAQAARQRRQPSPPLPPPLHLRMTRPVPSLLPAPGFVGPSDPP